MGSFRDGPGWHVRTPRGSEFCKVQNVLEFRCNTSGREARGVVVTGCRHVSSHVARRNRVIGVLAIKTLGGQVTEQRTRRSSPGDDKAIVPEDNARTLGETLARRISPGSTQEGVSRSYHFPAWRHANALVPCAGIEHLNTKGSTRDSHLAPILSDGGLGPAKLQLNERFTKRRQVPIRSRIPASS